MAARISSVRGPAPFAVTMPKVVRDEPVMPRASRKSTPVSHHRINAKPTSIRTSQTANNDTTAIGPTTESSRSLTS